MVSLLIYISRARSLQAVEDLRDFLPAARAHNSKCSITGALLFDGDHYFQILEGPAGELNPLLKRIAQDHRHAQFKLLMELQSKTRAFAEFSMGYLYDPSFAAENAVLLKQDQIAPSKVWQRSIQLTAAADRFA